MVQSRSLVHQQHADPLVRPASHLAVGAQENEGRENVSTDLSFAQGRWRSPTGTAKAHADPNGALCRSRTMSKGFFPFPRPAEISLAFASESLCVPRQRHDSVCISSDAASVLSVQRQYHCHSQPRPLPRPPLSVDPSDRASSGSTTATIVSPVPTDTSSTVRSDLTLTDEDAVELSPMHASVISPEHRLLTPHFDGGTVASWNLRKHAEQDTDGDGEECVSVPKDDGVFLAAETTTVTTFSSLRGENSDVAEKVPDQNEAIRAEVSATKPVRVPSMRIIANYKLGRTLGAGSMGKVKLATHIWSSEKLAVKIIPRSAISGDSMLPDTHTREENKETRVLRETAIMTLLQHPNIVSLREVVCHRDRYYMFMEYVDGGQMLDYIVNHGKLKERHAKKFALQIASALDYCHSNSIVHRDLKIENILISKSGAIKIIDFGLANLYSRHSFLSTFCGSLYFAAPELLSAKAYIGPEVDVWSFGVVIYVLVCGKVPFDDQSMPALHLKIKRGAVEYPSWLSPECKHLLSRMLVVDSANRASLAEVLGHPWMTKGTGGLIDTHVPLRHPLSLPLSYAVVNGMTGFEFGRAEEIMAKLETIVASLEYQDYAKTIYRWQLSNIRAKRKGPCMPETSPPAFQHPLVSIYYLVWERMEKLNYQVAGGVPALRHPSPNTMLYSQTSTNSAWYRSAVQEVPPRNVPRSPSVRSLRSSRGRLLLRNGCCQLQASATESSEFAHHAPSLNQSDLSSAPKHRPFSLILCSEARSRLFRRPSATAVPLSSIVDAPDERRPGANKKRRIFERISAALASSAAFSTFRRSARRKFGSGSATSLACPPADGEEDVGRRKSWRRRSAMLLRRMSRVWEAEDPDPPAELDTSARRVACEVGASASGGTRNFPSKARNRTVPPGGTYPNSHRASWAAYVPSAAPSATPLPVPRNVWPTEINSITLASGFPAFVPGRIDRW